MLIVWMQLLVCIAVIWVAGVRLSHAGDVIAEKMGWSRSWVGLVLLATVTSLPELITGLSAVLLAHTPDIALGDILGSCVFNLAILIIVDGLSREASLYTRASQGHVLAAGFGIVLLGVIGLHLLLAAQGVVVALGHVGIATPVIIGTYLVAVRTVFHYERRQRAAFIDEVAERYPDMLLAHAVRSYALAGLAVVGAGTWLPFVGEALATVMGWEHTFVGTLFIAAATSTPEVVVTLAAVRLGALDLAIGNLFGSNLFNSVILAVDDLAFLPGPLFAHVSPIHAVSALSAIVMTALAIIGLFYQPAGRLFRTIGWISLVLLTLYVLNVLVIFQYAR
jgi:cation:H+ antiporter